MTQNVYQQLSGKRLPVASHLVLHMQSDPEDVLVDGERLAKVLVDTARMFDSPLALPVMDLTLEKDIMLRALGIPEDEIPAYHFQEPLTDDELAKIEAIDVLESPRIKASCEALTRIAADHAAGAAELPIAMGIGPFSLLTKMMDDPITAIYMAGTGLEPEDDEEVELVYSVIKATEIIVRKVCQAQIDAGATAIFICEPAANLVYFSPKQLAEDFTVYEHFVVEPNKRLTELLEAGGVDLIHHNCGELTMDMVAAIAEFKPKAVSVGSTTKPWEAAEHLPKDIVIIGNLPTKKFYSDEEVPLEAIPGMVNEIEEKMSALGHPYIVSSECDVLSMPGYEDKIMEKVRLMTDTPSTV